MARAFVTADTGTGELPAIVRARLAEDLSSRAYVDQELAALKSALVVNVADYGAVGDYATDNTPAFDAAIADLRDRTLGRSWNILHPALEVPAGAYVFHSPLAEVDFPGLTILGQGSRATSFIWDGASALFTFGTYSATGGFSGGAHDYQFHGVKFRSDTYSALENNGTRVGHAIQDNGCGGGYVRDVVAMGFAAAYYAAHGADFQVFERCNFEWNDTGVYLGPGSQQTSLKWCTFLHNQEGMVVDAAAQGDAISCWFINQYVSDVTFRSSSTSRSGVPVGSGQHHYSWGLTDTWHETGAGSMDAAASAAIRLEGDGTGEMVKGLTVTRALYMPGGPVAHNTCFIEQDGAAAGRILVDRLVIRGPHAGHVYRNNTHPVNRVLLRDVTTQDGYTPVPHFDRAHEALRSEDTGDGTTTSYGVGARWELQNPTVADLRVRLMLADDGALAVRHWTGSSWLEYMRLEASSARITLRGEQLGRHGNHDYSRTMLRTSGDFAVTGRFGVGGTVDATTTGAVVKSMPVYDHEGRALGFVPIYDAIT